MADFGIENFKNALEQLKNYCSLPIQNERDLAGVIQGFEFTYELSWKAIQKKAKDNGIEIASPKQAYMFAIQMSWIDRQDEQSWIDLIKDRNLTTHTYKKDMAEKIVKKIKSQYLQMFEGLLQKIQ